MACNAGAEAQRELERPAPAHGRDVADLHARKVAQLLQQRRKGAGLVRRAGGHQVGQARLQARQRDARAHLERRVRYLRRRRRSAGVWAGYAPADASA